MADHRHHNTLGGTVQGSALLARDISAGTIVFQSAHHTGARRPQQLPLQCRAWFNRGPELATLDRFAADPDRPWSW